MCVPSLLLQLYEINDDPKRKEFLDDLFSYMQKRGKSSITVISVTLSGLGPLYTLRGKREKRDLIRVSVETITNILRDHDWRTSLDKIINRSFISRLLK